MAPGTDAPDANDRPPWTSDLRPALAGSRNGDARDDGAGPAATALMQRRARNASRGANLQCRAVEGLTPEFSRAEGVGLNDWLGLQRQRPLFERAVRRVNREILIPWRLQALPTFPVWIDASNCHEYLATSVFRQSDLADTGSIVAALAISTLCVAEGELLRRRQAGWVRLLCANRRVGGRAGAQCAKKQHRGQWE